MSGLYVYQMFTPKIENFDISIFNKLVSSIIKKNISGAVFYVSTGNNSIDFISASGNIGKNRQYYIASINKLFISALILKLYTEDKLDLEDKISKYLLEEIVSGLHLYRGKEYSHFITISHLMSHTSGLPCYLADKQANGKTAIKELEAGIDQAWPPHKVIQNVKKDENTLSSRRKRQGQI